MRCDKLTGLLPENFTAYITDPEDMRYYSGFTGEGVLLLSRYRKIILTDGRYTTKAKRETNGFEIIETTRRSEFIKDNNFNIAFQSKAFSYQEFDYFNKKQIAMTPFNVDFDALRRQKDENELRRLKKAAQIGDETFLEVLQFIKAGMTEREIAAKINYIMALKGSEKPSFDTICIGGVNTCMPHGVPTDYRIKPGDFVTMDFGCVFNGYCSDMTRTVAVGSATDEMKNVYEIVRNAQKSAQSSIKAGETGKHIDSIAREIIKEAGYGDKFVHSTGHGVGLKIHEYPILSMNINTVLQINDVVTVEPGIYIEEKFGVRIENTVLVGENSCESFQKTSKELIIL